MLNKYLIVLAVVACIVLVPLTQADASFITTIRPPLNPPTGQVTERFDVGSDLNGLTYVDGDVLYGATQFYSIRHDSGGDSFFTSINTGGSGSTAGHFNVGNSSYDALTFAAPDVGYNPTIFYYISHDNAGNSTFGTIEPNGVPYTNLFGVGTDVDALTFAATDVGYGANMFYYLRQDSNTGLSTFGTINPTPGGIVTDRYSIGNNVDALVFTSTDVGYGANMFYYLRQDSNTGNSTFGTINPTTGSYADRFDLGGYFQELAFTTTDVGYGPNLFYTMGSEGAIPEPSTLLLFGFGLPGLIAFRKRFSAAAQALFTR